MAKMTANVAFDMSAFLAESSIGEFFDEASVTTKTSSKLVLQDSFAGITEKLILTGSFANYSGDYPTSGTITGVNYSITDGASIIISNASLSVESFIQYVTTDDIAGLFGDLLDGADNIFGSIEADTLLGLAGDDNIHGGRGYDRLEGGDGNDRLYGEEHRDILIGGKGDDSLYGGAGKDKLTGGGGADKFIFADGDSGSAWKGADIITDFNSSKGDIFDLRGVDANANAVGDQKFVFIGDADFSGTARQLHYVQDGNKTWIEGDTDGDGSADFVLQVYGVHDFAASDFLL